MSEYIAVRGTRRAMKEMVDGTIRVSIDIDPSFRKAFLALFPEIDTPVAMTPLHLAPPEPEEPAKQPAKKESPAEASEPAKEPAKRGGGKLPDGLAGLAVRWCKEKQFQDWLIREYPQDWDEFDGDDPAETAKAVICNACQIESRKQLDHNEFAEAEFNRLFREPYRAHLISLGHREA